MWKGRGDRYLLAAAGCRLRGTLATAYIELHTGGRLRTKVMQCLRDRLEVMFANPFENNLVGSQQPQVVTVFNGVQRANPGVELLLWQFVFKTNQTLLPE